MSVNTDIIFAALVHAGLLEESRGRFLADRAHLLSGREAPHTFDGALTDLRSTTRDDLPDSPHKKERGRDEKGFSNR